MEITMSYQGREIALNRPETKYGSNIEQFNELVQLAFAGVGLVFEGKVTEQENG